MGEDEECNYGVFIYRNGAREKVCTMNTADTFRFGRSAENDVVLESIKVSREHFKVFKEDGHSAWSIADLNSKNGTWLKGRRIGPEPKRLEDGDLIQVGSFSIVFIEFHKYGG